ncbi:hypothetical protein EW145_g8451 [Phellinidium pouzarii]|uniref:Uncharacterized protein n=1 Tax=Phellinidium pouzarii TaxID=167371 RepID=A0A4S4K7Q1_9AGAM|nr:hypothetical protein EW145_g8451 [Phellinidium pouzarii]
MRSLGLVVYDDDDSSSEPDVPSSRRTILDNSSNVSAPFFMSFSLLPVCARTARPPPRLTLQQTHQHREYAE